MTRTALQATSDFYNSSPGIRLFRLALGASQRLWPALAVRAAYRLFATPLPPRWLRSRGKWDETWRIERWPFENAGITLYSQPVAPHGPVVLLAPGWGGFAQQMLPLAQSLAAQGLRPVIVEMPAHGRSPGALSNLPQFARVIEYVHARLRQEGHDVRAVVAHSLAANAAAYAAARGLPLERLVLLAPPASPREYTRLFAGVFGLSEQTRAAMQKLIEAREGILMPHFEPDAVGPRITARALVVHDRDDRVNMLADGKAYAEAIPQGRLVVTEGLGHRRILKDEDVLRHVTTFIAS
ncbi:MAG: alpha/beta hydrolase [Burkholderiaceae bacterium]